MQYRLQNAAAMAKESAPICASLTRRCAAVRIVRWAEDEVCCQSKLDLDDEDNENEKKKLEESDPLGAQ
jgi:endogenous inhibitor of DNA gyrase (YacG/DUF329 family)